MTAPQAAPDDGIILMPIADDSEDVVTCGVCHGQGVLGCAEGCHTVECPNECEEGYVPRGDNP